MGRKGRGGRGKKKKDEDEFDYDEDDDSDDGGKKKGRGRGKGGKGKGKGKAVPKLKIKLGGRKRRRLKATLTKSLKICWLRQKMPWELRMCKWLLKPENKRKGKLRLSLVTSTRRKARRRKILPMTSLNTRSSVRFASREARLFCAIPAPGHTICAVWIQS